MEFPAAGVGAGMDAHLQSLRAHPLVARNSRIFVALTYVGSVIAAVMGVLILIIVGSRLFPVQPEPWSFDRVAGAASWAFWACVFFSMSPWLWSRASAMSQHSVRMDERGVEFDLGTKIKPVKLFLAWENITAIRRKRIQGGQQYTVVATDGGYALFTSFTFFRPKKIARLIAARCGLTIEKG
jgi:hypothetical protein